MSSSVTCPRCPAGPWTEPGRLAGHLVELHGVGAAEAIRDSRGLIRPSTAAVTLVVKPTHSIVKDVLHRADVIETKPDLKETTMKKKRAQQKCRICTKPGHNAKSCTAVAVGAGPKARRVVAERLHSSNGAGADLVAKAKADARALVKSKIDDELVMARAYVAELERLASA